MGCAKNIGTKCEKKDKREETASAKRVCDEMNLQRHLKLQEPML